MDDRARPASRGIATHSHTSALEGSSLAHLWLAWAEFHLLHTSGEYAPGAFLLRRPVHLRRAWNSSALRSLTGKELKYPGAPHAVCKSEIRRGQQLSLGDQGSLLTKVDMRYMLDRKST